MDLVSMVACVWEVQTRILPTSATAHLVSKAPTVRRGSTGAACSHAKTVRWGDQDIRDEGEGHCMVSVQEQGLIQTVPGENPAFAFFSPGPGEVSLFPASVCSFVKWVR